MRALLAALPLLLVACGGRQLASTVRGAPRRPPDEQLAGGGGVSVFIASWHCVDGAHVVMVQKCYDGFPGGCDPWITERSGCGTQTPLEAEIIARERPTPVPRDQVW